MPILFQIARNTSRECLREPVFLLNLLSTLVLVATLPPLATLFVFREQIKMTVDSGLAAMFLSGWVAAVMASSHAVSREVANGTALLMMSKPVNRLAFVLGKILGVLAVLVLFCYLVGVAVLLAIQVAVKDNFHQNNTVLAILFGSIALGCLVGAVANYVSGRSFCMSAVVGLLASLTLGLVVTLMLPLPKLADYGRLYWQGIPALVLIVFAVCAMGALSTALSTRFDLIGNLMICLVIFLAGLISDYWLGSNTVRTGEVEILAAKSDGRPVPAEILRQMNDGDPAKGGWTFKARPDEVPPPVEICFSLGQVRTLKTLDLALATEPNQRIPPGKIAYELWSLPESPVRGGVILPPPKEAPTLKGRLDTGYGSSVRIDFYGASGRSRYFRLVLRPETPLIRPLAVTETTFNETKGLAAEAAYALLPNWQFFWMADTLAIEKRIPWAYVGLAAVYVLELIALFSVMGIALFQYREVGSGQLTE